MGTRGRTASEFLQAISRVLSGAIVRCWVTQTDTRYVPAIFDPSTRTLTIHPSTPLYLLSHRVKRLKSGPTDPLSHLEKEVNMYRMKRNDLGETFGTRKAKSQIKAQERNKVNVGAMEGVRGHLMDAIGEKAGEEGECSVTTLCR